LQEEVVPNLVLPGTFARVWLVRIDGAKGEDADKVFALKKLRKTDGMHVRG